VDLDVPSNDEWRILAEHVLDGPRYVQVPHQFHKSTTTRERYEWNNVPQGRYRFSVWCALEDRWSPPSNEISIDANGNDGDTDVPGSLDTLLATFETSRTFQGGDSPFTFPLVFPNRDVTIRMQTRDNAHALGYQSEQTREQLTVAINGQPLGETLDIPETATSITTVFTWRGAGQTMTLQHAARAGAHSVHGVRVEVWSR
jgi:hypothetical protein